MPKTPASLATGEWLIDRDTHFVYEAYDCLTRLQYIGITNDLATRLAAHRQWSKWYGSAARIVWTQYATRGEAAQMEERLIRERFPECNIVYNGGRAIALSMGHQHLYPSAAWHRLGQTIRAERGRRTQRSVAFDAKMPIAVLRELEAGETTRYERDMLDALEYGMGWQTGSVEKVLQGDRPEALTPELRTLRAHLAADRLNVMGGI